MGKRVIRGELSSKGIQSIIDRLQDYKRDLHCKTELLCKRLAEVRSTVAQTKIGESPLGKTISSRIDMELSRAGCRAILIASSQTELNDYGTVDILLLVEFGSGIHFNPVDNPKAEEFDTDAGTFPGRIYALDPGGWYYWEKDEEWHHTYGTKATMPMYDASVTIREQVAVITKEMFTQCLTFPHWSIPD